MFSQAAPLLLFLLHVLGGRFHVSRGGKWESDKPIKAQHLSGPVAGSGRTQDLSQLDHRELQDLSRRQGEDSLLFPFGFVLGRFSNSSRCHHLEPKSEVWQTKPEMREAERAGLDDMGRALVSRHSFLITWANKFPFSLSHVRSGFLFFTIRRELNDTTGKQKQPLDSFSAISKKKRGSSCRVNSFSTRKGGWVTSGHNIFSIYWERTHFHSSTKSPSNHEWIKELGSNPQVRAQIQLIPTAPSMFPDTFNF